MFILFHVLTGILIGYLLADRLGTRAVVVPCMIGAFLPDLVDKPLGILLLGGALGSGRIFLHTLLFLLVLLLAGVVVHRRYGRPALLAVGLGVASHQALDLMWQTPKNWLFPLLGAAPRIETEGWFLRELLLEIRDPLEWISGAALLVLLLPVLWPAGTTAFVDRYRRALRAIALVAVPALLALGLLLIATDAPHHYSALTGWKGPCETILSGAVLLLAAYAAYRLTVRLSADPPLKSLVPGTQPTPVREPRE